MIDNLYIGPCDTANDHVLQTVQKENVLRVVSTVGFDVEFGL